MEKYDLVGPSKDYLAKVAIPSCILPLDSSRRQLLILDLNGTLVSRTKSRGGRFYLRPHSESFFDYIFANFTVMVWSSATERSVNHMCRIFDPQKHPLFLIWNRNHFNLNDDDFYSNHETIKDLDYIWQQLPEFDATNTIIVDDTAVKAALQPHNLIRVSTFDHQPVLQKQKRDQDLCKVANYLRVLKLQSNVSNFICNNPFDLRMDWGIFPNDTLDYDTLEFGKKKRMGVRPTLPRIPQQSPVVIQASSQLIPSISSPPPSYMILPPLSPPPCRSVTTTPTPPFETHVNEESTVAEHTTEPSEKAKGKRKISVTDHTHEKTEAIIEPTLLRPRRVSISDQPDYIPLEPLTEEERHYIQPFGKARPISQKKIRKSKPKINHKTMQQIIKLLAEKQQQQQQQQQQQHAGPSTERLASPSVKVEQAEAPIERLSSIPLKVEQIAEQAGPLFKKSTSPSVQAEKVAKQQERKTTYPPRKRCTSLRIKAQLEERLRAYPSDKRFPMLRPTVRSPPPPPCRSNSNSNKKKVKKERKTVKEVKVETVEDNSLTMTMKNVETEKPPISLSTKIALKNIQRNIKDRKKNTSKVQ